MKELHKLEFYDEKVLQSFIDNQIEESIYIDFKSAEALSKQDAKKKELSKDVAAFANSDGGIIIYGIEEKYHKAHAFSFVDGDEFSKEWLEQVITSTINRSIPELKIFPVRYEDKIEQTIYVVQIPASVDGPHMSRDKRYYKRFNFESVMMDEYEVRSLYGRRVKSKLVVGGYLISMEREITNDQIHFRVEADIYNEGEKVEENYKLNVYLIGNNDKLHVSWDSLGPARNQDYSLFEDRIKISSGSNQAIYPGESITATRFKFSIKTYDAVNVLEILKIKFLLFYPDGEDAMETDFKKYRNSDVLQQLKEQKNGIRT